MLCFDCSILKAEKITLGGFTMEKKWTIKQFDQLTLDELYEIMRARIDVFVIDQDCNYQDADRKDKKVYHLYREKDGEIIAYMRILPCGVSYPEVSFGRVLVRREYRNRGIAREMLKEALRFTREELKQSQVRIEAQSYLQRFYESLGFVVTSEPFDDEGIEHIEMFYDEAAL